MFSCKFLLPLLLCSLFFLLVPPASNSHLLKDCKFEAIYQPGDSISDTGNNIIENPSTTCARLPYGQNFYRKAAGRCSNGLLMIDYIALSAGLPLLDAYLNPNSTTGHGVNFAVAGSTALPTVTNSSLTTQLDWMFSYFNTTCYNNKDCSKKLEKSLFMVGEIGGNDYNYGLFEGKTIDELKSIRSDVIKSIKDAIMRIIGNGATRIVFPGNLPIVCLPAFLTEFHTNNATAYDEFHCLKELNNLSMYHNEHLQKAIEEVKKEHSNMTIMYAFNPKSLQKACCWNGGNYNFNASKRCGASDVPVCLNPQEYISWDGLHSTQNAYRYMARWIIRDIFQKLQCVA
ncbi:hypothetical protein P3X46_010362 [Hevea brasiliensis]|uniref:Uncharacterized protein n=1 Tax=Hevea brasiliensis TaxID=3981 RepID=A0ABQ9MDW7_HEVBR|nr:hypothetical protein P3X46_010362 [Hevea brasiliensis]